MLSLTAAKHLCVKTKPVEESLGCRWRPAPQQSWTSLGHLPIGPAGDAAARFQGVTELLALDGPSGVLALQRSFPATGQWTARLSLHSAPPQLKPLTGWDLFAHGLPSDN